MSSSSYPPGGDYDERLLDNAPKASKAEKQEGYNVNLLASDSSDTPINADAGPQPSVAGHTGGAGTPPDKEASTLQKSPSFWRKWRILILIGVIVIVGAVVGGVVGGVVSHNSKSNKAGTGPTSTITRSSSQPGGGSTLNGAQPSSGNGSPLSTASSSTSQPTAAAPGSGNGGNGRPQAASDPVGV